MEWNNEYLVVGLIVVLAAWYTVKGVIRQFSEEDHGACSACALDPKSSKQPQRRFRV